MLEIMPKTAKLSDVNVMEVTIKEVVQFMDELKEGMPHAFKLIMQKFVKEMGGEMHGQSREATGSKDSTFEFKPYTNDSEARGQRACS